MQFIVYVTLNLRKQGVILANTETGLDCSGINTVYFLKHCIKITYMRLVDMNESSFKSFKETLSSFEHGFCLLLISSKNVNITESVNDESEN